MDAPEKVCRTIKVNAASPSWGYNYYNHAGRTIEFLNSQKLELLYNPEDKKTFLHYSGRTTNPDLTMVSSDIYENSPKSSVGRFRKRSTSSTSIYFIVGSNK